MNITVRYFAALRDDAGRDTEIVTVDPERASPTEIYTDVAGRYGFTLDRSIIRPAINGRYVKWDAPVADGDEIVFIPPVSGG